jgi:AraC-like DNA-binding protein
LAFDPDALQRASALAFLPGVLSSLGTDTAALRAIVDLPPDDDNLFDSAMPFSRVCRILAAAAELTNCPCFGLRLGAAADRRAVGPIGEWLIEAPDLRTALEGFIALQPANTRAAAAYLHSYGRDLLFGYGVYDRGMEGREQAYMLFIAIAWAVIAEITRGRGLPREVLFPFRAPDDTRQFSRQFPVPVRFEQPECGLVFARESLATPIRPDGPRDAQEWARRALGFLPPPERAWTVRVRHAVRPMVSLNTAEAESVASRLGVSVRTLSRRLQDEGTSYREVLEDIRLTMAQEFLALTDLPLADVSLAVAFANEASFYRAFRRWAGMTPDEWRRTHAFRGRTGAH